MHSLHGNVRALRLDADVGIDKNLFRLRTGYLRWMHPGEGGKDDEATATR